MTDISEDQMIAFVDGRLEGPALLVFEARLRNEADLADRVAAHRWMARQIVAAYGEPPGGVVDEALVARLGLSDGRVIELTGLGRRIMGLSVRTLAMSASVAASLVVGVFIGNLISRPTAAWLQTDVAGRLMAGGELAEGLSNELAGQSGPVRIGISFHTGEGICRTFSSAGGLSGLGCRESGRWIIPIVVTGSAKPAEATEYRLAGGDVAPAVMAEADRRMVGEPIGPDEEKDLKAKDWR